jgi:hypothetical protein
MLGKGSQQSLSAAVQDCTQEALMDDQFPQDNVSMDEIEAEDAVALPNKEVLSLGCQRERRPRA